MSKKNIAICVLLMSFISPAFAGHSKNILQQAFEGYYARVLQVEPFCTGLNFDAHQKNMLALGSTAWDSRGGAAQFLVFGTGEKFARANLKALNLGHEVMSLYDAIAAASELINQDAGLNNMSYEQYIKALINEPSRHQAVCSKLNEAAFMLHEILKALIAR